MLVRRGYYRSEEVNVGQSTSWEISVGQRGQFRSVLFREGQYSSEKVNVVQGRSV